MLKHEIFHTAGKPTPEKLKKLLLDYFSEEEIVRLERLGGRILISLASPYNARKKKKIAKTEINNKFVNKLQKFHDKPSELHTILDILSVKQLRELGKFIKHPLRTKSTRQELLDELVAHFYGEEVWRRISDIN